MIKLYSLAILLAVLAWIPAQASGTPLALSDGKVEFLAVGRPSAIKIRGKGSALTGTIAREDSRPAQVSGKLQFALDSLETGINKRDEHMKEKYLETKKYPTAEFEFGPLELPADLEKSKSAPITFQGSMNLHGVKKQISGSAVATHEGGTVHLTSELNLKLTDFGIQVPTFAGITVAEDVKIEIEFTSSWPETQGKK